MRCFTEELPYTVAIITGENNPRYSKLYAFYCKLAIILEMYHLGVITLYSMYNLNQNYKLIPINEEILLQLKDLLQAVD